MDVQDPFRDVLRLPVYFFRSPYAVPTIHSSSSFSTITHSLTNCAIMAFISTSLLAEPPLISLSDDDSTPCCTKPSTQIPTTDLMDFAEQSSAERLYDEIYRKNIVKFLATGAFASRITDTNRVAASSLVAEQETCAESRRGAYRFDYGSEGGVEMEFEAPDKLPQQDLVCLSDEAAGCVFVGGEDSGNSLGRKETPDRPQPVWPGSEGTHSRTSSSRCLSESDIDLS